MNGRLGRWRVPLVAALALAVGTWGAVSLAQWVRQAPARRHFRAGLAAVEEGRPQDAEREWREAVRVSPDYLPPYRLLVGLYLSTGLWRKGHEVLEQFLAAAPTEPHLECQLAEMSLRLNALPDAEEHARREVARDPACGRARLTLGRVLIYRKNEREAVTHLREAVRCLPGEIDPQIYLAQAYVENMRLAEAQGLLTGLLARHPDLAHAQYMLGFCYARNAAEPDGARKAEAALRRALALNPQDEGAMCELGRLCVLLGRPAEAVPLLEAAARAAPGYPPTFHHLGRAYRALHRPVEACRAEARYLALNRLAMEESVLVERHGLAPTDPTVVRRLAELRTALDEAPAAGAREKRKD
jgi:protein O-GlcNAc transferase